jgi:chromate reductase
MHTHQVAVIVGSIRRDSLNRKLADALAQLAPASMTFKQVSIAALPLYNQDDDAHQAEVVMQFKGDIAASQSVLFVTPEYNRSIPGGLKNALDHGSRPYGQSAWAGKPAGVIGVSPGACGTAMAQQHLRNVLVSLDMPNMTQPEAFVHADEGLFNESGHFGADSRVFMQAWMDHYWAWVQRCISTANKTAPTTPPTN